MAIFTTRNVKQLYVANAIDSAGTSPGAFVDILSVDAGSAFHLRFTNYEGQIIKSDRVALGQVRHIKATPYTPQVLRVDKLTVAAPVVGQDYMIRVLFKSWGSGSQENQYVKHIGAYKAVTGNTAETIVDNLVALGNQNLSRESGSYLVFSKENGTNKLVITEVAQPWSLGKMQGRPLEYVIQLLPIINNGVEVYNWATFETTMGRAGNGTYNQAADLEYFYMGERGDQYGMSGYPFNMDVNFLVQAGSNYHMLDIAYFERQEGEGVQASEKQMLVLCKVGTGVISELISEINDIRPNSVNVIVDPIPGLTVTPAALAFDPVVVNATDTETINISGVDLPGPITLAMSSADGYFTTDLATISAEAAEAEGGQDVIVTFAPKVAGAKVATLLVKSGDLIESIAITGTATAN